MDCTRGRFITLEGGEGAGKSTQARLLVDRLNDAGIETVLTREPGGSAGAEEIRSLLVTGDPSRWDAVTETLLHVAARRDHVVRMIEPALAAGRWVVCDRYIDSTIAYQGYGQGVSLDLVRGLNQAAIGDLVPDLTLIFDVSAEVRLARVAARPGAEDRYERMTESFHHRVRSGFSSIAESDAERCWLISAEGTIPEISDRILSVVAQRFPEIFRTGA